MKMRWILALSASLVLCSGLSTARAAGGLAGSGDPFTLYFDEYGNGFVDNRDGTGLHALRGTLMPPPTGGSVPVLTYLLPSIVVTGDVRIWEDANKTVLSDILRFTNAAGDLNGGFNGTRLIVYSDIDAGEPNPPPADTGLPVTIVARDGGGVSEVGPEGNNVADYFPGGLNDNIYHFVSDGVIPEPSSVILLGVGGLGAAGYGWRRRVPRSTAA
jgi:hypothetical protein